MIKVKYERYWNDYRNRTETESFQNLAGLEEWIFGQMQQGYDGMYFPTPENAKRYNLDGPGRMSFTPVWGEESIWIKLIESDNGIIFSDGTFTNGVKHWSKGVQEWLTHCDQRKKQPTFRFVDDDDYEGSPEQKSDLIHFEHGGEQYAMTAKEIEAAYRYQQHQYLLMDAQRNLDILVFGSDAGSDHNYPDEIEAKEFFKEDYGIAYEDAGAKEMLEEYLKYFADHLDCNESENYQWETAIKAALRNERG